MAKSVAILGLFALLVVIIVGIALAVYFTSKKNKNKSKSDDEEPSEKKPELTFDLDATKTINPQEEDNDTQEGYAIEYAGHEGGKNIDLTLNWTNGQGFGGTPPVVTKLIFTRYLKIGEDESDWKKIQADKATEVPSEISDYGSGSVTFKGGEVTVGDVKGYNIVRAYYNEMKPENLLAEAKLEITEADFDQVMSGEFLEIVIPVSIKEDSFSLTSTVKKTYYNLSLSAMDSSTQLRVVESWYTIKQDGDKYKFIGSTGEPLKLNGNTEFKIQKYQGSSILLRASDDKIFYDDGDNGGAYAAADQMRASTWKYAKFELTSKMASDFPTGQPSNSSKSCDLNGAKREIELKMEQGYQYGPQIGEQACKNNNCTEDCWA